jgi:hypothetical protein
MANKNIGAPQKAGYFGVIIMGLAMGLILPMVGRIWMQFAWMWIADHSMRLSAEGILNTQRAREQSRFGSDADYLDVVIEQVRVPLNWMRQTLDAIGMVCALVACIYLVVYLLKRKKWKASHGTAGHGPRPADC